MTREALDSIIVPGTDKDVVDGYCTLTQRALDTVFGFEDEVCLLDIETTGVDAGRDRIIEVAAAIMKGTQVVDRFSTFVDPLVPIPAEITRLTGIDDSMVAGAPVAEAAVAQLASFVGSRAVVAHNCSFDRSFIERVGGRGVLGDAWIDSVTMARIGLPRLRSHRQADLGAAFASDLAVTAHRATHDVEVLCRVWRVALVAISDLDAGMLVRIADLAPGAKWPEREWLSHIAAAKPDARYDLKGLRRRRVTADKADQVHDAEEVTCSYLSDEEITSRFDAQGLAGRIYTGYEHRSEQVEMATAVTRAFRTRTHAAIEAGTGVGKSMAYLVSAVEFALANGIGVGVATKTNALMDQLVYQELPRLSAALGTDVRSVALKGYDHYVCLRKLERAAADLDVASSSEQLSTIATLLSWASQSSWGDLDAVNLYWRRDLRATIQATQADCTHRRCPFYPNLCYLHGVRRRAQTAHIVVTNHALLFRDAVAQGGILPPLRHWIVDEAHSAESEARKQLTNGASYQELVAALSALHGRRGGLIDVLKRGVRKLPDSESMIATLGKMDESLARCLALTESLFTFVKDLAPLAGAGTYDAAELWVAANVRESGPWGVVASTGGSLATKLESLIGSGRELMTALEEHATEIPDQRADLAGILSRLADQRAGLVAVIDGSDPSLVYSAHLDRRPDRPVEKLVAARLDVGEALAEDLYPRIQSIVYTSATIATGDSFSHFARSVGLDRLAKDSWHSLRLSSSYDFERQMAVFVPTDLPDPRDDGYVESLEALLEDIHIGMGGSVLTLFTNRRDMERLHAILESRLRTHGLELVMQGRGTSAKRLRDEFLADKKLSLFALKSFWEGFDAKGDTLRCVVVPKLPFGRPTDPLACERELREGRAAWARHSLPEAILELKQAAGRLIRSADDSGCLVIADARVLHKGYGTRFLKALPVQDVERLTAAQVGEQIRHRFGAAQD